METDPDDRLLEACHAARADTRLLLCVETPKAPLWFADHRDNPLDAPAVLDAPEAIRLQLGRAEAVGAAAAVTVALRDPGGALRNAYLGGEYAGCRATLFLAFAGLDGARLPLVRGVVSGAGGWEENGRRLDLVLADVQTPFRDRVLARRATRALLPRLPETSEGRGLPLVFGSPRRVRAVPIAGGAVTTLARGVDAKSPELVVADALAFPEGPVRIRVGDEEMLGSFTGNRFTAERRGLTVLEATVAESMAGSLSLRLAGQLAGIEPTDLIGRILTTPYAGIELRALVGRYRPDTQTVHLLVPVRAPDGQTVLLAAGDPVRIESPAERHAVGTQVYEVGPPWVYLVADHAVAGVDAVEGYGPVQESVRSRGLAIWSAKSDFQPLPAGYAAIDPADDGFLESLGHPVATVSLPVPPTAMGMDSDELWVDVRGLPRDPDTALAEESALSPVARQATANPAEVLLAVLERAGVAATDIDRKAFADAAADRADEAMAFALDAARPAGEVLADLAFQARLFLRWTPDGVAAVAAERLEMAKPLLELGDRERAADTLALGLTPDDELASGCVARFRRLGREESVVVTDPEAEAAHGPRVRSLDAWAYDRRRWVRRLATWHLRRWRHRWHTARVGTFLAGAPLEPGDQVRLLHEALPDGSALGRIRSAVRVAPAPSAGTMGGAELTVRLDTRPGCRSSCETACQTSACETSGCELGCEAACETACETTCEAACEGPCELACTAACEVVCENHCMAAIMPGGCSTSAEGACESSCQADCQLGCQICCENTCETRHIEHPRAVRRVAVLNAGASLTARESGGDEDCDPLRPLDPFDLRPGTGAAAVFLDAQERWNVVAAGRDAKLVKVVADLGGDRYQVVECDPDGVTWGPAFTAQGVPGEEE